MDDNDVKLEADSKVKIFICSICQKGFMVKSNLHKHLRSHFGKKPFKCPICGIYVGQNDCLDNHISFHINGKIYKCSSCYEEFPLQTLLQKHLRKHHILHRKKPSTRPSCNICQKTFHNSRALKEHCPTHSDEKPYVCGMCQKGFSRRNYLLNHIRLHHEIPQIKEKASPTFTPLTCKTVAKTEKKSFTCHVCQKAFHLQSELNLHLRKHAGGNPFTCDVCKEGFSGKFELFKHLRTHFV